ncbi:MAG: NERD domain-containing protein/DEAD/DEAH box helicase [Deltaproteobacteria bacterium]|nr:NERD domain-containing protein/DEAD/DEAH box helicase [Deltaproteobacteria bacterium]
MAHMIPREPPQSGPGSRAERELFLALSDNLDDDHFVYSRLSFLERDKAREGECDFLIVHRERGMLAVECKGGGVRRRGDGEWMRSVRGREQRMKESPFEQAQRTIKTLEKQLWFRTKKMFPKIKRFPFVHGHVVAFPLALSDDANLPLDVAPETLWDAADLDDIGVRVGAAFDFWSKAAGGGVKPLEGWQFKQFRRKALHPKLGVVECLGADIRAEERELLRLSDEQVHVVEQWLDNPRLRVKGGAGTGKTVLAVEAALQLADDGLNVQLLCFNRPLANYLRAVVESADVDRGEIRVSNFHSLCRASRVSLTDRDFEVPSSGDDENRFWSEIAPTYLLDSIADGRIERPDAMVIDEGQDFAEMWWTVLDELLGGAGQGRMLVFYDPAQAIFHGESCVPEMPTIRLNRNFRNTKNIAEVVCELGQVEMETFDRAPDGDPPDVRDQESPSKTKKQVANLLQRLVRDQKLRPDQIAILTPHTRDNSCLAGVDELGGYELASKPMDRQGKVLHTTIGRFKGLESDVVIMLDVDPDDPRCGRHERYVAASRAKHRLYVFTKGEWRG